MSHLLLLVVVVVVRRLVRSCREVVRSIALVVHHIQATHSDRPERLTTGESQRRETRTTTLHSWDFRLAVSSEPSVPPYMPKPIQ